MLRYKIEYYTDVLVNISLDIEDEEILETLHEATMAMESIYTNNFDLYTVDYVCNDLLACSFLVEDMDISEMLFEVSQFIEQLVLEVHREEVG